MHDFLSSAWLKSYERALNADAVWRGAAKYLSGKIGLRCRQKNAIIGVRNGAAIAAAYDGRETDVDIWLSGCEEEWRKVRQGETDFVKATSQEAGDLSLDGDVVFAMRNIKTLWLSLEIISRLEGAKAETPAPSPEPMKSARRSCGRYLEVDGIQTYYEEAGEGRPLVCFHAACQDTLMYRHVLDQLSDEFRVIAVDALAHGKSGEPPEGPFSTITQHAAFNEKFINALNLDRPAILGCSMGGNLVLEMGARKPDAYGAIISAEGADFTPTLSEFILDMLLLNGPQILECYGASLTGKRTPPARAEEVIWQLRRAPPEVMRNDLQGYAGFDMRKRVPDIRTPVLLIRGEDDWLVLQDQVEATASRIPDVSIKILKGTGHYPMIENPVEFNALVKKFLLEKLI